MIWHTELIGELLQRSVSALQWNDLLQYVGSVRDFSADNPVRAPLYLAAILTSDLPRGVRARQGPLWAH
jgi:hypothetical protein